MMLLLSAIRVRENRRKTKGQGSRSDHSAEHQFNEYQIKTKMLPFQHTVIFHLYSFLYSTGDLKVPFKIHDEYNIGKLMPLMIMLMFLLFCRVRNFLNYKQQKTKLFDRTRLIGEVHQIRTMSMKSTLFENADVFVGLH